LVDSLLSGLPFFEQLVSVTPNSRACALPYSCAHVGSANQLDSMLKLGLHHAILCRKRETWGKSFRISLRLKKVIDVIGVAALLLQIPLSLPGQ
jgi:hypothetical protein